MRHPATGCGRSDQSPGRSASDAPAPRRKPLVARTGLVDPDMDAHALIVSHIDRVPSPFPNQPLRASRRCRTVLADALLDRDVLLGDFAGTDVSCRLKRRRPKRGKCLALLQQFLSISNF
jgi:hypothetical protein